MHCENFIAYFSALFFSIKAIHNNNICDIRRRHYIVKLVSVRSCLFLSLVVSASHKKRKTAWKMFRFPGKNVCLLNGVSLLYIRQHCIRLLLFCSQVFESAFVLATLGPFSSCDPEKARSEGRREGENRDLVEVKQ